ncbi:MAG: U32 family peptidase [Clostridia bacterium]|nr:U32 family peptidase [Clostridia bacterium]
MPYELIQETTAQKHIESTANKKTLNKGYLLSTKDLCSLDFLPTLVNLGITCFKIEGRLKSPEYVATVTRIYRKYIDLAQSNSPYVIDEKDRKDLLQVFNRGGFSTGYLDSNPNKNLIYKNKPNNMGILVGAVSHFNNNKGYITLKLQDELSIGDTVSLEKEKSLYTISELMINNKNVISAHTGDIVKIGRIKGNISINDKIFKMSSKALNNFTNKFVNEEMVTTKINCKITVHKHTPVSMQIYTNNSEDSNNIYNNINFSITSDLLPIDAINSPISAERIIEQINKLGGTPFEFENIDVDLEDNLYIPSISKLNQLRRDCINKLEEVLLSRIHRNSSFRVVENVQYALPNIKLDCPKKVSILLNNLREDFNYASLENVDRIYIPIKYFFMPKFRNTIMDITHLANTYIYTPSILKDSVINAVSKELDTILSTYAIKGFVISNLSYIHLLEKYSKDYEFVGNYNMNVYNNYTIRELGKLNISCITLSPELDRLCLNSFEKSNILTEAIVYGNLPVMTTNYCLLSESNFCLEKCSGNCSSSDKKYFLKDRLNMHFRIVPDSFSKTTTIYNSKKTSISANEVVTDFIRLDFWDEDVNEIVEIINTFKCGKVLEGKDFTNGNFGRSV